MYLNSREYEPKQTKNSKGLQKMWREMNSDLFKHEASQGKQDYSCDIGPQLSDPKVSELNLCLCDCCSSVDTTDKDVLTLEISLRFNESPCFGFFFFFFGNLSQSA